jgi:hypothetical protein
MKPIEDRIELNRWIELSGDQTALPFERSIGDSLMFPAFSD